MRHLKWVAWVSVLLGMLTTLAGCSVFRFEPVPEVAAPRSSGMLVSGRYSTQQGTMRWLMEFTLHADGQITHVLSVEGTDKFADFWREQYQGLVNNAESEFTYAKEETENRMKVMATRVFPSAQALNDSGSAHLQLLDGPLFRSLVFKSETGSYDPEGMVNIFGSPEQATAEDWAIFLQDAVSVAYVVRDEVTGRTYQWDRTAGEIGEGVSVLIQGKQWHRTAFVGGGVIGMFLLFVIYMGLFGRRHWASEE